MVDCRKIKNFQPAELERLKVALKSRLTLKDISERFRVGHEQLVIFARKYKLRKCGGSGKKLWVSKKGGQGGY